MTGKGLARRGRSCPYCGRALEPGEECGCRAAAAVLGMADRAVDIRNAYMTLQRDMALFGLCGIGSDGVQLCGGVDRIAEMAGLEAEESDRGGGLLRERYVTYRGTRIFQIGLADGKNGGNAREGGGTDGDAV